VFTIGILASGKGSNAKVLIEEAKTGNIPVRVGLVASDNPDAGALEIARKAGVPSLYIDPGKYRTFLEVRRENEYAARLKEHGVQLVCLAGFMRVIKSALLNAFPNRIINIHPSLLPSFPGIESWKQALDYGVKFTGCTVHFVEAGVDTGPIILQAVVPVLADDTPETLHARIQRKEHLIYPIAVRLIAEGRVSVFGRRVRIE
jgi:phosphoribosylglycinamide formyltransferase-1